MSRTMNSVNEYFETLPERFRSDASRGVDAVFQWEIAGQGGRTFHAQVAEGRLTVADGKHASPSVTLEIAAEDYLKIVNGKMNGMMAVMTKKMKVNGNIILAKKMQD